ncbi:MAG: EVE domain-containing protein [Polyangiaceae bacterium]
MAGSYWLVKSEPFVFSFDQLIERGSTHWDGVRNHEARNHLRAMKEGDLLLYYHSNEGREIVGIARVAREAYADPTAPGEDWSVVDVEPVEKLARPVSLDELRTGEVVKGMVMHRRNRLSVTPVTEAEFKAVLALSKEPAPPPAPPKPKVTRAKAATEFCEGRQAAT